tara:strand:+ start:435 stop:647 length:213 start_codon:yes stop_codon:yes gene_type:complete
MIKGEKSSYIISQITLSCIKHNFVEFVDEHGYELGVLKIAELFGDQWDKCKYEVMQWYDFEIEKIVGDIK